MDNSFDELANPGWFMVDGQLRKTVTTNLIPGASKKEVLVLKAVNNVNADYINYAEIGRANDITGAIATDSDSNADYIKDNDAGGEVGTSNDDRTNGTITEDEDDHDPAKVNVFDLALKNVISDDRTYDVDEIVTFEMTIYNQGNVSATSLTVTNLFQETMEFVPELNASWNTNTGNDQTVEYTYNEVLEPNHSINLLLKLRVIANNDYQDILNTAEISAFTTEEANVTVDFDSDADNNFENDLGGNVYNETDNMINDHGLVDEDDHDAAKVRVRKIDLALMKTVNTKIYTPGDEAEFTNRSSKSGRCCN